MSNECWRQTKYSPQSSYLLSLGTGKELDPAPRPSLALENITREGFLSVFTLRVNTSARAKVEGDIWNHGTETAGNNQRTKGRGQERRKEKTRKRGCILYFCSQYAVFLG